MSSHRPTPSPTVWFYLDRLDVGGPERIVLNLLKGLDGCAWSPALVLNQAEGAMLPDVPVGIPIHGLAARSFAGAVSSLAGRIRHERPAIIVSQRGYLNLIVVLALLLSGHRARLILTEHTLLSHWLKSDRMPHRPVDRVLRWLMPVLYRAADAVVGISEGVAGELERALRLPRERITILYNPVIPADVERLCAAPLTPPWPEDGKPLILAAGRLSPEKGFDLLIRAFARVLERRDARLAIVGSGPERERLEALAEELGVAGRIHFPGFQGNIYPWLQRSELFALSSVIESFPTVLIEAMALGKPVVAFDCPKGPREIITPDQDGLLIPPEDPVALADGILRVLDEPGLAAQLAAGARQRAEAFTFRRTIGAYEQLFSALLRRPA